MIYSKYYSFKNIDFNFFFFFFFFWGKFLIFKVRKKIKNYFNNNNLKRIK